MGKFKYFIVIFTLFVRINGFSQEITNVKVSQEGTNVLVSYDLGGTPAIYKVDVFYTSDDGKTWYGPLKHITGDVNNQTLGKNKKIFWNAGVEIGQIEGYVQFKLFAGIESKLTESKTEAPGYSPQYYKYKKSKTIWLVSTLTFSALGTFAHLQANSAYNQYQTATTDAADLHKKVKQYDQITPIAYGMAGFCALEFILKAGKQSKAKKQSLSFYPQPVTHGAGIGLAYTF